MNLHDAENLARQLMLEHGLADWDFGFDRARRRAGYCRRYKNGLVVERGSVMRTAFKGKISVSARFVAANDEVALKETVLHEIAHALVGNEHHHDDIWREKAISIGCSGRRCCGPEIQCFSYTHPPPLFKSGNPVQQRLVFEGES